MAESSHCCCAHMPAGISVITLPCLCYMTYMTAQMPAHMLHARPDEESLNIASYVNTSGRSIDEHQ